MSTDTVRRLVGPARHTSKGWSIAGTSPSKCRERSASPEARKKLSSYLLTTTTLTRNLAARLHCPMLHSRPRTLTFYIRPPKPDAWRLPQQHTNTALHPASMLLLAVLVALSHSVASPACERPPQPAIPFSWCLPHTTTMFQHTSLRVAVLTPSRHRLDAQLLRAPHCHDITTPFSFKSRPIRLR